MDLQCTGAVSICPSGAMSRAFGAEPKDIGRDLCCRKVICVSRCGDEEVFLSATRGSPLSRTDP